MTRTSFIKGGEVYGRARSCIKHGGYCMSNALIMWKYIHEMGVLAQQKVVSCVGFLGKYVINFAGLHSDWLGYGQLIWVGIFSLPELVV